MYSNQPIKAVMDGESTYEGMGGGKHGLGWWQGEDMLPYYPDGAAPIVRGEAVNTATTYGYDRVTMMQETKTTLCQVARA